MDVSREGLDGHVSQRECGNAAALCGGVNVFQPNVGLKRTGVNTDLLDPLDFADDLLEEPVPSTESEALLDEGLTAPVPETHEHDEISIEKADHAEQNSQDLDKCLRPPPPVTATSPAQEEPSSAPAPQVPPKPVFDHKFVFPPNITDHRPGSSPAGFVVAPPGQVSTGRHVVSQHIKTAPPPLLRRWSPVLGPNIELEDDWHTPAALAIYSEKSQFANERLRKQAKDRAGRHAAGKPLCVKRAHKRVWGKPVWERPSENVGGSFVFADGRMPFFARSSDKIQCHYFEVVVRGEEVM